MWTLDLRCFGCLQARLFSTSISWGALLCAVILTTLFGALDKTSATAAEPAAPAAPVNPTDQQSSSVAIAEAIETPAPQEPSVAAANEDGRNAIANIKFDGLKCDLWAAEPNVANIVAFHMDYQGQMFVCETFRQDKGVEDNRAHTYWLEDELAALTVEDRVAYILKHHPDANETYTRFDDRIRLVTDTDGDGKADTSKVFANRFNSVASGTGAGVLSHRGEVFYTCIPDLVKLKDTDGDGAADERTNLHSGYGVHFAYRGHDMHGLIVGPDGRLYFSLGDRGHSLPAQNLANTDSGSVFRCELDAAISKSLLPACETRRNWHLIITATCSLAKTTQTAEMKRVGCTFRAAATPVGDFTISILATAVRSIEKKSGTLKTKTLPRTLFRRSQI